MVARAHLGMLATIGALWWSTLTAQQFEDCRFKPVMGMERPIVCATEVPSPAKIDGTLDEPWWAKSVLCENFTIGNAQPAQDETCLMVAYDAQNLYLAAICFVKEPAKLVKRIPPGARDKGVWGDDCVDFKISPDGGKTELQFLVNANGARDDMRNSRADWNPQWQAATRIAQDSYIVEMAIPLTELGVPAGQPGTAMLFTFGRGNRTLPELSSAFEPYGDLAKAPILILGTEKDFREMLASSTITREVAVEIYLDRDQYPSFEKLATGRVHLDSPKTGGRLTGKPIIELALWQGEKQLTVKTIQPVESTKLDFDLNLAGLAPAAYELSVAVKNGQEVLGSAKREFLINEASAQRMGRIEIAVPPTVGEMPAWPITFGIPFPWGALDSPKKVRLTTADGKEIPIQTKVTSRWSRKGSIRWLLVDFIPPVGPSERRYVLEYGPDVRHETTASLAMETDSAITITTGPLRLLFFKRKLPGLPTVWLDHNADGQYSDNELMVKPDNTMGAYMIDDKGNRYDGVRDADTEVALEDSGPLKACVRVSGWHVADSGQRLGKYILRYYAYRGLPYVRLFHTFIITEPSDRVRYSDIGYSVPFPVRHYFFGTPRVDIGFAKGTGAYIIQLDDQHFKTYEDGTFKDEGFRAEGWLSAGNVGRMITLSVKDFWQQFPKELEVKPNGIVVHFWPAHGEDPIRTGKNLSIRNIYHQWFVHEGKVLNFKIPDEILPYVKKESDECYPGALAANAMGLAKTHELLLHFHANSWEDARAHTASLVFQDTPAAVPSPQWVCNSKVFGEIVARDAQQFSRIEKALDESFVCIARQSEMDRDYGMFNFGDSHHNWIWQERRWNLHRIWRNTHHGWTRWPWLLFARSGQKRLLDWADRNARHVADVDHCHYATKDFTALPHPRGKRVGGICDYKGFVHWASGNRLCYNSAADAMLWHYYMTGNERSLTAALEHGAALIEDGQPQSHREGSGRATSAQALYFHTWDNDYLEFLERTVDTLLGTQREDGGFPQWENFAPFLQRYIELTHSRRAMKAMARWADWTAAQELGEDGYHAKINILSHAYLYTGDEKYLRVAARRVSDFVDHIYDGEDPRYRGMFINFPSNLDQSYFMQEVVHYLAAVTKLGREPEPQAPKRSVIRVLSREKIDGKERYVFHARLRQNTDTDLRVKLDLRGAAKVTYVAQLTPLGGGNDAHCEITSEPGAWVCGELALPKDSTLDYELLIHGEQGFFVKVPITAAQPDVKEVYPIFREGTWVGEGFRFYFAVPEGAEIFTLGYHGRAWPMEFVIYDPSGKPIARDVWEPWSTPATETRTLRISPGDQRGCWSFANYDYGMANIVRAELTPPQKEYKFYFAAAPEKYFAP